MPWMMSWSICTMDTNANIVLRSLPFEIAWIVFREGKQIMQEDVLPSCLPLSINMSSRKEYLFC